MTTKFHVNNSVNLYVALESQSISSTFSEDKFVTKNFESFNRFNGTDGNKKPYFQSATRAK